VNFSQAKDGARYISTLVWLQYQRQGCPSARFGATIRVDDEWDTALEQYMRVSTATSAINHSERDVCRLRLIESIISG
jgi:hypothetical protein